MKRTKILMGLMMALGLLAANLAEAAPQEVSFPEGASLPQGTIVIHMKERKLYYVLGSSRAIRYPVAVPKSGAEWSGYTQVTGIFKRPAWSPPAVVKRDHPELPNVIPGGDPGNPMGAAAITLQKEEIAIHGTTAKMRASIGSAASYGCIRMYNEDVAELAQRVQVGTWVLMVPSI